MHSLRYLHYFLLLTILLSLPSYQIPSVSSKVANSFEEAEYAAADNGHYELAFENAMAAANYFKEQQLWDAAIKKLYNAIIYTDYFDADRKERLIRSTQTFVDKHLAASNLHRAGVYHLYGELLYNQQQYDSAAYYLQMAIPVLATSRSWSEVLATSYILLGYISSSEKDYHEAIKHYQKAEQVGLELNDSYVLDMAYNAIGRSYYQQQDFERAIDYTQKSIQLITGFEYVSSDASFYLAEYHQNLGVYYNVMGDHKRAELYYKTAFEIHQKLGTPQQSFILTFSNYTNLLFDLGRVQDAILINKNALATHKLSNSNEDNYLEMSIDFNKGLSRFYQELNDFDSSFYYINCAINDAQLLNDPEIINSLKVQKGRVHLHNKEFEAAKTISLSSLENIPTSSNLDNTQSRYMANRTLGEVELEAGNYEAALEYFQNAIAVMSIHNPNDTIDISAIEQVHHTKRFIEILSRKAATLERIATTTSLQSALEHYQVALQWIEKMRQSVAFEDSKIFINENSSQLHKAALALAQRLYERTQDDQYLNAAFKITEQQKSVLLLESLIGDKTTDALKVPKYLLEREENIQSKLAYYQQKLIHSQGDTALTRMYQDYFDDYELALANLRDTLAKSYKDYFALEYQSAITDINTLQNKLLNDEEAFIQFVAQDSAWLVFIIEKNTRKMMTLPFGQSKQGQLNKLMTEISSNAFLLKGNRAIKDFSEVSHQVYQALFAPIEAELSSNAQSIIIAADRQLNLLPFEALIKSPAQTEDFTELPYLVHDYAFQYAYSASLLHQNRQTFNTLRPNKRLLAFAPAYGAADNKAIAARGKLSSLRDLRDLRGQLRNNTTALEGAYKEVKAIAPYFDGYFDCSSNATETVFKTHLGNYGLLHLAMHGKATEEDPKLAKLIFANTSADTPAVVADDDLLYHYEITNLNINAQLAVLSACETGIGKHVEGEGTMSLGRSFMYSGVPSVVMSLWQIEDLATSQLMPLFYEHLADGEYKNAALRNAKLDYLKNASTFEGHPFFWSGFIGMGESQPLKKGFSFARIGTTVSIIGVLLLGLLVLYRRRVA